MRALNDMKSCLSGIWKRLLPSALVLSAVLAVPHALFAGTPQDGLALSLELASTRAYAGETVPYTVRLRNSGRTLRNVGYPHIETHGLPAVSPGAAAPRQGEEESAQVFVFSGTVTPDKAGTFLIGPARLECEVMEAAQGRSAFFGGVEPRTVSLVSEPVSLTVLPLPAAGRPDTFSGAVGSFTMTIVARPDSAAVGDPLTIIAVIGGTGTLSSAACPSLAGPGFRSYPVRASQTDGQLRCEQVLVPDRPGPVPPVVWSYFDPQHRGYRTLTARVPIHVSLPQRTAAGLPDAASKASPSLVRSAPATAWLFLVPLLLLVPLSFLLWHKRRAVPPASCPQADPAFLLKEVEQASAAGDVEKFYSRLFILLQHLAAADGEVDPPSVTGTHPSNESLSRLLSHCDEVRYGGRVPSCRQIESDLEQVKAILGSKQSFL